MLIIKSRSSIYNGEFSRIFACIYFGDIGSFAEAKAAGLLTSEMLESWS